jgi:signal transduction histidine kinase
VTSILDGLRQSAEPQPNGLARSATPAYSETADAQTRSRLRIRRLEPWSWLPPAAVGLFAGVWLLVLVARDEASDDITTRAVLVVMVAWSFVASGLIASRRSPEARLGRLMTLTGLAVLVGPLMQYSSSSLLVTIGIGLASAWYVLFVVFLLSFPHGRLESRGARLLLLPFVIALGPLMLLWFLFWEPDGEPGNPFLLWPNADIADAIDWSQRVIVAGGALALTAALAKRWRFASPSLRRSLTPILVGGAATVLASVTVILDAVRGQTTEVLDWILLGILIAVPLAVLADMLRARLAQSAIGGLVVELSGNLATTDLRDALARALHDPSLSVAYWLPEFERYADRSGRPVELRPEPGRATTEVRRGGEPVAALLHDESLQREPALLDAAVAAAGIAFENGRLESELRARVEELRRSRSRLVEVAQTERRRLERDLHDGAQQRLVALSLRLRALEKQLALDSAGQRSLEEARLELDESLHQLRELARGIHPAIVTEHGLAVALEGVAARAPVPVDLVVDLDERLPEAVEVAAYYLVAETLTNVAKHARAESARVEIRRNDGRLAVAVSDDGAGGADADGGSGLRGLEDRVEALGGRLAVVSPPGGGTRIMAEIPYG